MSKPEITATLRDAMFIYSKSWSESETRHLQGNVYADTRGRWHDGWRIQTSAVMEEAGNDIFVTMNGVYKVESWEQPSKELPRGRSDIEADAEVVLAVNGTGQVSVLKHRNGDLDDVDGAISQFDKLVQNPSKDTAPQDDGWEWAIVEIFGHRSHIGRIREEERFSVKMMRIDVPVKGNPEANGWETHYYSGGSIFSMTPTDEATALNANKPYEPPSRVILQRLPEPESGDRQYDMGDDLPY